MKLTSIELPQTYYNISSAMGNNYMFMSVKGISGKEETRVICIDDGNYTPDSLICALNQILSPTDCSGNVLDPSSLFSYVLFSVDIKCSGIVFVSPVNTGPDAIVAITMNFSLNQNELPDNTALYKKLGWVLGFTQACYSCGVFYESESPIQTITLPYIYLGVNDFNNQVNNGFISAFQDSILNSDILARITLDASSFGGYVKQSETSYFTPREYFGPVDISRLHIRLYDEYGRIVSLNGRNFSFCLQFHCLYDL